MKKRKTNLIKLGILLFGISLFLFNCEKEEVNQTIENNSSLKTVSKKESLTFLNDYKVLAKGNSSNLTYDISKLTYEKITNSNSKLAIIPAKVSNSDFYSRILLLKVNDTIRSVVYNMLFYPKQKTANFSGEVFLTNLNGKLIKAFRYLDGVMTNIYLLKQNNSHYRASSEGSAECRAVCGHSSTYPDCICNIQALNEIEMTVSSNNNGAYISVYDLYGGGDYEDDSAYPCEIGCNGWDSFSGGSGDGDNSNSDNSDDTTIDDNEDPSCKSFNFKEVNSSWQESSVVNIRFNIVLIEIIAGVRIKKVIPINFPEPVKFGMPIKFANGTEIPPGLAAEIGARAINHAIDDVISRYNNLVVSSTSTIRNHFQERLKLHFQDYSNGGRVNFNDMSATTNISQYKTYGIIPDNCY